MDLPAEVGGSSAWRSPTCDPALLERAIELSERYPPDPDAPARRRQRDADRPARALPGDPRRAAARRRAGRGALPRAVTQLGMRSAIIVPMVARGRTLGAITLRDRPLGPALRRAGPGARRGAGPPLRAPRSTTPASTPSAPTSRARSSRACCRSELPDIPGIEAAARFRPTGEGNEVGGDFYDLFETGDRGWTVVMGDVCGKGPDAAAVTALARYTLRAAAMRERLPEPQPRHAERGAAAPARRPPLLHRRLRLPRDARPRRADRLLQRRPSAAAAAARGRQRRGRGRAGHAARRGPRPELRGPRGDARARATRSSSTRTA